MSNDSISILKYAISIGYNNLLEAYDAFETFDKYEISKYWTMCEELAEAIGIDIQELTNHI